MPVSTTGITTHVRPASKPSDSGIAPVSWLLYRFNTLAATITGSHRGMQRHAKPSMYASPSTGSIATHVKPVNEPSDAGMAPVRSL
jgi:hypothetical protein